MKQSRMKLLAVLLAALMLVLLVGCSGETSQPSAPSEKTETASKEEKTEKPEVPPAAEPVILHYYGWADEATYGEPVIKAFNASHSDIQVEGHFLPSDDYYTKILTMLQTATSDFDLLSVNGLENYNQYQQLDGLADMTDLIASSGLDISMYGPTMTELLVDDQYYALPYRSSCYALFYNKDVFDAAGLDYPIGITWDEYAEIAKELTKGEGDEKIWGGFIPDWMRASLITIQRDSNFLDDDLGPTTEWLTFLNRLYNEDCSHMSFPEMRSRQIDWVTFFESGNVGMLPNGEWTVGLLNADKDAGKHNVNWDVAPLPTIKKGDTVKALGGVSTFVSIYKNSKHIDEAFEFVQFYCGQEGGKEIAASGMLPAYVDDDVKAAFVASAKVEGADALLSAETYLEGPALPYMAQVYAAYAEEKELYLTGQETIEDFERNFIEKRAEALGG